MKLPEVNQLCKISGTCDFDISEDRQGGILVADTRGNRIRFESRRQCLDYLKRSGLRCSQYALDAIRDDLRALGDKKGLRYE